MATGTRAAAKTESTETHRESLGDYPLEEKIRQRAHEIWLQRAGGVGSDVTDATPKFPRAFNVGLTRQAAELSLSFCCRRR